jgi:hypothetical protein
VLLIELIVPVLIEERMVLMLIEILVMKREIVKMEMIGTFDSLMVEVHYSLDSLMMKVHCSSHSLMVEVHYSLVLKKR